MKTHTTLLTSLLVLLLVAVQCAPASTPVAPAGTATSVPGPTAEGMGEGEAGIQPLPLEITDVSLRLKWAHAFQSAGYDMALLKGFYEEEGLNVKIEPAGVELKAPTTVASGADHFGEAGPDQVLLGREKGAHRDAHPGQTRRAIEIGRQLRRRSLHRQYPQQQDAEHYPHNTKNGQNIPPFIRPEALSAHLLRIKGRLSKLILAGS